MPAPVKRKQVWDKESLRNRAKAIGYYVAEIKGYAHDYLYLVKKRPHKELQSNPFFRGQEGEDWISLGAMADMDSVSGVIAFIESQQKLRKAQEDEDGMDVYGVLRVGLRKDNDDE